MKPLDAITKMQVEEGVRNQSARLLHDTLAADLTNLSIGLECVTRSLDAGDTEAAHETIRMVYKAAISANSALRFARVTR